MTDRSEIGGSGLCALDVLTAAPRLVSSLAAIEGNVTARHILDTLVDEGPMTIGASAESLAARFDVDRETALRSVTRVVQQGQQHGLISVTSDVRTRLELGVLRRLRALAFVGMPAVSEHAMRVGWRREHHEVSVIATLSLTILGQAWLAIIVVALVGLVAMPMTGSVPWAPGEGIVPEFGVFALSLPPVLMVTGAVHEVVHLLAARASRVRVHSVYSTGVGVGMVRDRSTPLREVLISASGPLVAAGLAAAVLAAVQWSSAWPASALDAVFGAFAVVILYNVACLIPPSTDGACLSGAVRAIRNGGSA